MTANNVVLSAAEKILNDNLSSWTGNKTNHNISLEDLRVLIQAGGMLTQNVDNQDGTFFYEVSYQGHVFVTSSAIKIVLP